MQATTAKPIQPRVWVSVALPLIALLAPTLGGATALWGQAAVLGATGLLFLIAPPNRSAGRIFDGICVLTVLVAASAFLPARWFPVPEWRTILEHQFAISLPPTRSPQPWLTLEATWLLVAGVAWAYYLLVYSWERNGRRRALRIFGAGIVALAAAALAAHHYAYQVPFWSPVLNSVTNFGFFPNRNQTAGLLALSGIVVAALAYQDLTQLRKRFGFWLIGLAVIVAALVSAYSRAGIVLFFGGTILWVAAAIALTRSPKAIALTAVALITLFWGFIRFGGATAERFKPTEWTSGQSFRALLHHDAWRLSLDAPLLGSGLGNFEPLFRLVREESRAENRALHPESDWLWLAADAGWLLTAAFVVAWALWLRRCLPFSSTAKSIIELAALIYGLGFAVHGLVDVSGHRLGTIWPALLVMSTALRPQTALRNEAWVGPTFRSLGLLLMIVAGWWTLSVRGFNTPPTSATLARLRAEARAASARGVAPPVIEKLTDALRIAPLDWTLYYERASIEADFGAISDGIKGFRVARYLQGSSVRPCIEEGRFWVARNETEFALEAWTEAARRSLEKPTDYREMLAIAASLTQDQWRLTAWARLEIGRLLAYMAVISPEAFVVELERLLASDPNLSTMSAEQRQSLFKLWAKKGNPAQLVVLLGAHPAWQAESWRFLAEFRANAKDYHRAYATVRKFAEPPTMPALASDRSIAQLERDFVTAPHDLTKGLPLYAAQLREQKFDGAIRTLEKLQQMLSPPRYLWFMEAELQAERQEWELAWKAWSEFASSDPDKI